jgi:hypothetical protein
MDSRLRLGLASMILLATTVSAGTAQGVRPGAQRETPFPAGAWSLSFSLPSGGGASLGVFKLVGPRTNLGLDVVVGAFSSSDDISFSDGRPAEQRSQTDFDLAFVPSVRQYVGVHRTIAPYIHGNLLFGYNYENFETVIGTASTTRNTVYQYAIGAGVGVEWTPLERISVGGHTGVRFSYFDRGSETGSPAGTSQVSGSATRFETFVSSLVLQLYF